MTTIIGIDPGSARSAIVVFKTSATGPGEVLRHHLDPNEEAVQRLSNLAALYPKVVCACELTRPYAIQGADRGFFPAQLQDTAVWVGRFWAAWQAGTGQSWLTIDRRDVKRALLGRPSGTDRDMREALIDRFGGTNAVGTKASPGPLHGITRDRWAALAVAVALSEGARTIRNAYQTSQGAPGSTITSRGDHRQR